MLETVLVTMCCHDRRTVDITFAVFKFCAQNSNLCPSAVSAVLICPAQVARACAQLSFIFSKGRHPCSAFLAFVFYLTNSSQARNW